MMEEKAGRGGRGEGRIGVSKSSVGREQSLTFFESWRSRACVRGEWQG